MAKNPFKVGDRVYVYPYGWGDVVARESTSVTFMQQEECKGEIRNVDVRGVSFTEYDLVKGGLSHDRPETLADAAKRWAKETREDAIGFIGRIKGQDLIAKLESNRRNDAERDTIPAETAERNLKALNYIKKLLKEDYNVVDDFISVEELGDEVQVSLTFRKG